MGKHSGQSYKLHNLWKKNCWLCILLHSQLPRSPRPRNTPRNLQQWTNAKPVPGRMPCADRFDRAFCFLPRVRQPNEILQRLRVRPVCQWWWQGDEGEGIFNLHRWLLRGKRVTEDMAKSGEFELVAPFFTHTIRPAVSANSRVVISVSFVTAVSCVNGNYLPCMEQCQPTCTDPDASECLAKTPNQLGTTCVEGRYALDICSFQRFISQNITDTLLSLFSGCVCAPGLLLSGNECVRPEDCGCSINGRYEKKGTT